jgi:1-acyl-sn-glycerol-3-phosphate acyltransferase
MTGSYGITAFAVWKTLEVSLPTVMEALVGRLSMAVCDQRLQGWARALVDRAEVQLEIHGRERLTDEPCVLMSNHQSHFDIPICFVAYPRTLRMVAKAELFRVPIWGRAMREAGFVSVDRSGDRAQATAAMLTAAAAIRRGVSVWIAPEGTRSPDGKLGRFKKGGFLMALKTGVPIVPMAIDGSRQIIPKKTKLVRTGARVRVTFGAPISVAGRDLDGLMQEVRSFMAAHITQPES